MSRKNNAFTLVEVLIVVVIMGILAATVVPQFVGIGDDANVKSRAFNAKTLNSQVILFKSQTGALPTDLAALVTAGYLTELPENSVSGTATENTAATHTTTDAGIDAAWLYNTATGVVIGNDAYTGA